MKLYRRILLVVLFALVLALGGFSPAAPIVAAPPNPTSTTASWGIHVTPGRNQGPGNNNKDHLFYVRPGTPVMLTNTVYNIFWVPKGYSFAYPSGDPSGQHFPAYINQFVQGVATDNGKMTNPYSTVTQYYESDPGGRQYVQYNVTFGGSVVDTNPFSSNPCVAPFATTCIDTGQVQDEVGRVVDAQGWPRGLGAMYMLFTPIGVGVCGSTFSGCTDDSFCAYHEWYTDTRGTLLFGYIWDPGVDFPGGCVPFAHTSPSGDFAADSAVGAISHEQIELMTDPIDWAWMDRNYNEIVDKCAWRWGTYSRDANNAPYNYVINGHEYLLQEEFSNASSDCVQSGY